MALPLFFHDGMFVLSSEMQLGEETARHVVQVLRLQPGACMELTDGKGHVSIARILSTEKKKACRVIIDQLHFHHPQAPRLHLAIAFTKNAGRNEWLLEKATELGVADIIPVIAARTERDRIRHDRWKNILVAAMIQSRRYYLPELSAPAVLGDILQRFNGTPQKLIGHCMEDGSRSALAKALEKGKETVVLIGPEGDFTADEVRLSGESGFVGIDLGTYRLRSETAAMAVCAYFNLVNYET